MLLGFRIYTHVFVGYSGDAHTAKVDIPFVGGKTLAREICRIQRTTLRMPYEIHGGILRQMSSHSKVHANILRILTLTHTPTPTYTHTYTHTHETG